MISVMRGGAFLPLYALLRWRSDRVLRQVCVSQRAVVLTYDDGPGAELTAGVRELLAAHGARATFFLLGRRAEQSAEVLTSLVSAGHDLGVHTYAHSHPWSVSAAEALEDIERGYGVLAPWAPADGLFRPPHGKLTWATWRALRRRKAPVCWWTVDSGDTWPTLPPPQQVVDTVLRAGGGVVLMHDFDRGPERARFVLETTRLLLNAARGEGLKVLPFSALLDTDRSPRE